MGQVFNRKHGGPRRVSCNRALGDLVKEVCMSTAGDTQGLAPSKDNQKSANLLVDGEDYSLPIYEGTIGPDVIDITRL